MLGRVARAEEIVRPLRCGRDQGVRPSRAGKGLKMQMQLQMQERTEEKRREEVVVDSVRIGSLH